MGVKGLCLLAEAFLTWGTYPSSYILLEVPVFVFHSFIPWCQGITLIYGVVSWFRLRLPSTLKYISEYLSKDILVWLSSLTNTCHDYFPIPICESCLWMLGLCPHGNPLWCSWHWHKKDNVKGRVACIPFNECERWTYVSYQHISHYAVLQCWKCEFCIVWGF